METLTRRSFLALSTRLAAAMGLCRSAVPGLAASLEGIARGTIPVLWLQGQSCSGCSISLLNSDPVSTDQLLTRYLALLFHQTLSSATGHTATEQVNQTIARGGYVLLVEGSVPVGIPKACLFGEEPFTAQLLRAARAAQAVVCVGSCAAFGGVPAAEGNPTGAVSVREYLTQQGVTIPLVSVPGCPIHPDWLVGTVAHLARFGLPPLDSLGRPLAFFSRVLHDQCPRFADYERENFATKFSDPGCLFKLGCLGPITHADCTRRAWNSGANHCIRAGAPCTGCASPHFARRSNFPLLLKSAAAAPATHS